LLPPSVTVSVHLLQHVGIACYAQRCTSYSKSVCPSVTCWSSRTVPQEFKDVLIVHIFKRKGDRSVGISLLSIPGKILARIILNRLTKHVSDNNILPESQCGFRSGRGTMDMIFTAGQQLQEKCREQQRELYAVFIDLTKAFDSVDRSALWEVLLRIGCPPLSASFVHFTKACERLLLRMARCLQTLMLPVAPNKAVLWPHFCSLSSLP